MKKYEVLICIIAVAFLYFVFKKIEKKPEKKKESTTIESLKENNYLPLKPTLIHISGDGKINDFMLDGLELDQYTYSYVMGTNPSYYKGEDLPVEAVSWYDAINFCNEFSDLTGLERCYTMENNGNIYCDFSKNGYRLPTKEEWQYAAKGGNRSQGYKYSGSDNLDEVAWYIENSGSRTHIGAEKKANELGLCDMSGNVVEWVWDASGNTNYRLGGGCQDYDRDCEPSTEHCGSPSGRNESLGFRLACSV